MLEAGEHLEQRRFTAAAVAEEAKELAGVYRQRNVVERGDRRSRVGEDSRDAADFHLGSATDERVEEEIVLIAHDSRSFRTTLLSNRGATTAARRHCGAEVIAT